MTAVAEPLELPGPLAVDEPAPARPRRRWRWLPGGRARTDLAVLAGYALVAWYVTQNLWRHLGGYLLATNATDQIQFEYFLRHAVQVVTQGQDPFHTPTMNAPVGVNLMANTATLGLHLPLVPVTLLFGPATSFAVMVWFSLAGTAAAWYWLLSRHVVTSRAAAIVGGAFCGFAPGMVSQANGHPNVATQVLVPVIVWRCLRLRESVRPVRAGIVLGLLIAYQAFVNEEVLLFTALALGVFVLAWSWWNRAEARRVAAPFLRGLASAAVTAGALLAYPLFVQFLGPQAYHGLGSDVRDYGGDVQALWSFSRFTLAGHAPLADQLSQNPSEQNTFLGWPLLVLAVVLAVALWRRAVVRAAVVTGVVLTVASLGPRLRWGGTLSDVPGPYAPFTHVPVLNSVIATRLALVLIPVVGLLLALWLELFLARPRGGGAPVPRRARLVAVGMVVAALVPLIPTPLGTVSRDPTPTFFTSGAWHRYVPAGRTVVTVPVTSLMYAMDGMRWSVDEHLELTLAGGYFLGPNPARHGEAMFGPPQRPTARLLGRVGQRGQVPVITDEQRAQAVRDLRYWRAAAVVLAPRQYDTELLNAATELIGFAPEWTGGVWVWDVRSLVG